MTTTSGADGADAAGDCEAGEAAAGLSGGTETLSFFSPSLRRFPPPSPTFCFFLYEPMSALTLLPFLSLSPPLSLSLSLLVSKTQMGVPRRRRRRRASLTASRRRCCSPPASRRTWWAQAEGMSGAAGCGCGDAAVSVCRARRRRRHAGRRGGDSRCCGVLRLVWGAFELNGLWDYRLTGTALDGWQGMMPAQKLKLRPSFVDCRRVWAQSWRSEAAAVGISGGVVFSADEDGGRGGCGRLVVWRGWTRLGL